MGKAWVAILLLSTLLSVNGLCFAIVFGLGTVGKILSVIAIFMLITASVSFGNVVLMQAFTGEVQHILDGKDDIILTLKVGPFSYTRIVPTEKR